MAICAEWLDGAAKLPDLDDHTPNTGTVKFVDAAGELALRRERGRLLELERLQRKHAEGIGEAEIERRRRESLEGVRAEQKRKKPRS